MIKTLVIAAATLVAAAAHANVSVSMLVQPETTLPGIPVSFSFDVVNSSTSPVTIADGVNLEIVAADGSTFYATWDDRTSAAFPVEIASDRLVVPAGGTRELYLPIDRTLAGPDFFNDLRLNRAGRFLVRAHLYSVRADGSHEDIPSNEARLEVRTPEGDDLAVFGMLIEASASGETWTISDWVGSGTAVAAQILSRYPHSAYAPYATLVHATQTQQERLDAIELALAQRPPGPVADLLLAVKGSVHAFLSDKAFGKGDLDRATTEARAAQTVLRDLIRTTPYPFVRDEASATLNQVKDPEGVRSLFDAIHQNDPPAPVPVSPFVDCVERSGSTVVARFGYANPNLTGKFIQPGNANRLTPGEVEQGQPRYFMPGRRNEVVSAIGTNGKAPAWRLDGKEAVATAQSPECAGIRASVRPVIECLHSENEGVVVTFGYDNPNPFTVVLPFGDGNRFDSEVGVIHQPDLFLPGRQVNVFKVKVKDSPVTWMLDGRSVTASPRDPLRCFAR